MSETDTEIEARCRREAFDMEPKRLRILGAYEVVALLRIIDGLLIGEAAEPITKLRIGFETPAG